MKHITILALYDATLTSIDSSHQLFSRVNDFMRYQGRPPFYEVHIAGAEKQIAMNGGRYYITADYTLQELKQTDVIVLPLLCGDFAKAIKRNEVYKEWLIDQYHRNAEIVCLCVGSFFLASTGLLKNRSCAVHWAAKQEFSSTFSDVHVIDDSIITDEKGIYTCGGGFTYLNLLLYIIEKHAGRDMSILASKMFEIDIERRNQHSFAIFIGQRQHGDELVLQSQDLIEHHPAENYSVSDICNKLGIGRRTFERRFKKGTGNSVMEYMQRVKVEFAKKQLETSKKTINEIVYEAGYNDPETFRRVFKKFTDLSPAAYRKRYAAIVPGEKQENF